MNGCQRLESGTVELFFYGELEAQEQASVEQHVASCQECRHALEELSIIQDALATVPVVAGPTGGDWSRFMGRLDEAIRLEDQSRMARRAEFPPRPWPARRTFRYVPQVAMAALLALVTMSVAYVARTARPAEPEDVVSRATSPAPAAGPAPASIDSSADGSLRAALAKLSEQHFERSKLVVLGLTNKDAKQASQADWEYERQLASHLLDDTRLYRMAAEEKGMRTLAGVMGDLELVLLQASLAGDTASEDLEQIQRLIHKRDLIGKMETFF
jgi:hypothetical protein